MHSAVGISGSLPSQIPRIRGIYQVVAAGEGHPHVIGGRQPIHRRQRDVLAEEPPRDDRIDVVLLEGDIRSGSVLCGVDIALFIG